MHVEQVFFAKDVQALRNWKVVLCQEPRGQRSEFTREGNPELALFDMGNNADHVGLRVDVNPTNIVVAIAQYPDANEVVCELITQTQILVEEITTTFEGDNDDENL
jgi:hypothetical protein